MTHNDIYIKFMIEYDKANVTSSYPSLTEYEVAVVLDKAYNALIAQKITGNNVRRSTFESDIKSIADLSPLVTNSDIAIAGVGHADNSKYAVLPGSLLYFLQGKMSYNVNTTTDGYTPSPGHGTPADSNTTRDLPLNLVSHDVAKKFFSTAYNMPWIKEPVCYIEDSDIYVVYDPLNTPVLTGNINVTYIKKPNTFVKDLSNPNISSDGYATYFDFYEGSTTPSVVNPSVTADDYVFECNSTVAEELINLAVSFALENVESTRLNSKLNMRGLEA